MRFFVGVHHPHQAHRFEASFISANTLRRRKGSFPVNDWILDSGAFTILNKEPHTYPEPPEAYVAEIRRWKAMGCGRLIAAVSQDYMCEASVLEKTGLSVGEHQRLTIERYDAIRHSNPPVYIMPILQGYAVDEYVSHLAEYGWRLYPRQYVGVGSVCGRTDVHQIHLIFKTIKRLRPDLRLHGFGLHRMALHDEEIRGMLESADSMAWSSGERWRGGDANDYDAAERFQEMIETMPLQRRMAV